MYAKFKFESIPLDKIMLDTNNPRIVTQQKLATQAEIVKYLFEFENLDAFIRKIANEGKNTGAERPYVVKNGKQYTVVEGNTRIAAYKILTGMISLPEGIKFNVPSISISQKSAMTDVDCSVAPDRDSLLPIMAQAHFGTGDKSKWGYLGSRKAVFDEYKNGRKIKEIARAFDKPESDIRDLLLEYQLYLEALKLKWSPEERAALVAPSVEFNPPVRFLQTGGHKGKVGIEYDKVNIEILFTSKDAKKKFQHLIKKLVLRQGKGLSATSLYDDVFKDYSESAKSESNSSEKKSAGKSSKSSQMDEDEDKSEEKKQPKKPKDALFPYAAKKNNALLKQLMIEAQTINIVRHPASSTLLLRMIVEITLKELIVEANANKDKKSLDLEGALNLCMSNVVKLSKDELKVLKEFKTQHLDHINLATHVNVKPNESRLKMARDCVDQFIKSHI